MNPLTEEEEFEFRLRAEREATQNVPQIPETQEPSRARKLASEFLVHPLIEGGAMAAGGLAGAAMGSMAGPAAPVAVPAMAFGTAAAMYPPGKRAAESVDRMMGINPPAPEPVGKEFATGLGIEAGGQVLGRVAPYVKPLFRGAAKKMANFGQTISGARAGDLMTAYDQGLATYAAPGMKKAGRVFDESARVAGINPKPTLEAALDPALSTAKQVALETGKKLESGVALNAQEALYARQAVDRIIAGTSAKDKATIRALSELRGHFDNALASSSPAMKEASNQYRKSIVKRNLLKPFPVNKSGEYSRLHTLLLGLGSGAFGISQGSFGPLFKGAALLGAASPLSMGLGASVSGEAAKGVSRFLSNPIAQRATIALTEEKAREFLKKAKGDKGLARQMAAKEGYKF